MRKLLTVLVSGSMFLFSFLPFVSLAQAKQADIGSVKSTTGIVLTHGSQMNSSGAMVADHESHFSHSSHESHASHYSSSD
jgi:hypothetical protein